MTAGRGRPTRPFRTELPSAAFTQLTFAKFESLVWMENENSSLFVEKKDQVRGYEAVVRALGEVSLTEDESMNLIARRCVRLQAAGEGDAGVADGSFIS